MNDKVDYPRIFAFITKITGYLRSYPRRNINHQLFLFCNKGHAFWLSLASRGMTGIAPKWDLHYMEEKQILASTDGVDESPVVADNQQVIDQAHRACKLFDLNGFMIPDPIFPKPTKAYSRVQFLEAVKEIYPIYNTARDVWTRPELPEGLTWKDVVVGSRIVGYSADGRTEFEREFIRYSRTSAFRDDMMEYLPETNKKDRRRLVEALKKLHAAYRSFNERHNARVDARKVQMQNDDLRKEAVELAKIFKIPLSMRELGVIVRKFGAAAGSGTGKS